MIGHWATESATELLWVNFWVRPSLDLFVIHFIIISIFPSFTFHYWIIISFSHMRHYLRCYASIIAHYHHFTLLRHFHFAADCFSSPYWCHFSLMPFVTLSFDGDIITLFDITLINIILLFAIFSSLIEYRLLIIMLFITIDVIFINIIDYWCHYYYGICLLLRHWCHFILFSWMSHCHCHWLQIFTPFSSLSFSLLLPFTWHFHCLPFSLPWHWLAASNTIITNIVTDISIH